MRTRWKWRRVLIGILSIELFVAVLFFYGLVLAHSLEPSIATPP